MKDRYDHITEVKKFNPFHDARGRFASASGFKSYSANPNTKSGAMAISRSVAAGHMYTRNSHKQSTGDLKSDANWMKLGNGGRTSGSQTLRRKVEPVSGLRGASAAGATWYSQNQARGKTTAPSKKPAKQQSAANINTLSQQSSQAAKKPASAKPAASQQKAPKKTGRKPVDGKDITGSFKYDRAKNGSALDQAAEKQGFKGKPTVIKDSKTFSAAVKDSGIIAYRTINSGKDTVTGKRKTGAQFADDLKNSDSFSHNGSGGQVYGGGIYIAANKNPVKGKAPSPSASANAKGESQAYGHGSGSKTVAMTLDKNAKVGDYNKVMSEFKTLSSTQKSKFGNEIAAYATSKGYDALRVNPYGGVDYVMVYNRTKLIIFDS